MNAARLWYPWLRINRVLVAWVAKHQEKKRQKSKPVQPPLPGMPRHRATEEGKR